MAEVFAAQGVCKEQAKLPDFENNEVDHIDAQNGQREVVENLLLARTEGSYTRHHSTSNTKQDVLKLENENCMIILCYSRETMSQF